MGFRGRQESGRVYPDSGRGGIDGDPPSRPVRMRRVGVRWLSVVVAEYTGHGDPPG